MDLVVTSSSKSNLVLNQVVTNFGIVAKVTGFHYYTGDPILTDDLGASWVADEKFCHPAE